MVPEVVHARHLAEFGFLKRDLEQAGYPATIVEKSEAIPLNVLLAAIEKDHKNRDRFINFSFVPLDEDDLSYIQLLQIYTTIPCDIRPELADDVGKLLLAINCRLAIGHFSVKEDGEMYYRYVHSASYAEKLRRDEIMEILALFLFMLNTFAKRIDEVASGDVSLSDALAELG